MKQIKIFFPVFALCIFCFSSSGTNNSEPDFPQSCNPTEVGNKLAKRFIPSKHMMHDQWIHYAEVCTWLGALRFAKASDNRSLMKELEDRFAPFFTDKKGMLPIQNHVDLNMFGCLPLEFYLITRENKYRELGLPYADSQWTLPENATPEESEFSKQGLSWQTRFWIDDMYMINIIQLQAFRVTGDIRYINRAAKEMVVYLQQLQRPNGLFYHAPDAPFYWGRGNGWMAAGMTELLRYLPQENPDRPYILDAYRLMMDTLKKHRNKQGIWNQLIDEPDCWPETSGSAMFTYAMIMGIKNGWLDKKEYEKVARKAWISLVAYVNDDGDVTEVCAGTNKSTNKQHYYDRPRITGDFHGQAPMLWCAYAWLY
jgi:Predicted unsaturated glucuronyl hydrolase involved in regulation of bacterial surface properties, and related proteins